MTRTGPAWRIAAAGLLIGAAGAAADERPATIPTRDVDVTYATLAPNGAVLLQQRMRWSASARLVRLDPPSRDLYFVMDLQNHLLDTIRPSNRAVLETNAPGAGLVPGVAAQTSFARKGPATVAGVACTEWETVDAAGRPALACLTEDGVLLRAQAGGQTLVEARSVHYGPIDKGVFAIPPDYTKLTPPTAPPQSAPAQ
ncbi:MAG: hypothetical protein JO326_06860 [Acetobacteraceae bacterium]|nr:hypothetical protein [Acetobacteraceae bacterium]